MMWRDDVAKRQALMGARAGLCSVWDPYYDPQGTPTGTGNPVPVSINQMRAPWDEEPWTTSDPHTCALVDQVRDPCSDSQAF